MMWPFVRESGARPLLGFSKASQFRLFGLILVLGPLGRQAGIFDLLHCNFRKARSAVFSLLHCKLKEARLVSSICFTAISGRQDLLSLVYSNANSGRQDWCLRSASLQLQESKICCL
ncbi:hypothetical protein J1N35_011718 [Gossypium stocksii]|uniref:Uncharacterized protein n=1 Tax=Gossypium stocksii TaxID=47602 RepID=A0A9D3W504_9ROSI|nr:hypothetical protein J1N35_011718 [Gossypium stocksii]